MPLPGFSGKMANKVLTSLSLVTGNLTSILNQQKKELTKAVAHCATASASIRIVKVPRDATTNMKTALREI